jgi:hypothetical protein
VSQADETGVPKMRVGRPFGKFDLRATTSGLTHLQFFISSFVNAHCVRFFSGRLANGQVAISPPLSLAATARRVRETKPFRTLAAQLECMNDRLLACV